MVQVTVTVAGGKWSRLLNDRWLGSSVTVMRSTVCDHVLQMQGEDARTPGMSSGRGTPSPLAHVGSPHGPTRDATARRAVRSLRLGGGVVGEDFLSGDLAAFDLRHPPLPDTHAVGDLLLGQAARAANLGEAVSDDFGEQLPLARFDPRLPRPRGRRGRRGCRSMPRIVVGDRLNRRSWRASRGAVLLLSGGRSGVGAGNVRVAQDDHAADPHSTRAALTLRRLQSPAYAGLSDLQRCTTSAPAPGRESLPPAGRASPSKLRRRSGRLTRAGTDSPDSKCKY
jgi:hypothetical protein